MNKKKTLNIIRVLLILISFINLILMFLKGYYILMKTYSIKPTPNTYGLLPSPNTYTYDILFIPFFILSFFNILGTTINFLFKKLKINILTTITMIIITIIIPISICTSTIIGFNDINPHETYVTTYIEYSKF